MIDKKQVIDYLTNIGYTLSDNDETNLDFVINLTEQRIKNFCNISELPQELDVIAVEMAAGEFLNIKWSLGQLDIDSLDLSTQITSIKEGDTQVSYATGVTDSTTLFKAFVERVTCCDNQLIAFRKLRW